MVGVVGVVGVVAGSCVVGFELGGMVELPPGVVVRTGVVDPGGKLVFGGEVDGAVGPELAGGAAPPVGMVGVLVRGAAGGRLGIVGVVLDGDTGPGGPIGEFGVVTPE